MRTHSSARLILASLAAVVVGVPAAGASQPGDTEHGVDRDKLAAKAERVVEERNGIEVRKISRCGPAKRKGKVTFSKWVCEWRAEGLWPGQVPYHCAGNAVWKRKRGNWRVDKCRNRLQPQAPLLDTPNPHPVFGYNDNWIFHGNSALNLLDQGGGQVARTSLAWWGVEDSPGHYNWGGTDALYQKLVDRGIAPLWVLIDAPCWAQANPGACQNGNSDSIPAEQHLDEMADFAVKVAQRYPESTGIEVWNEPNFPRFWGGWPDVAAYSRMLKEVAGALHSKVPGMPVVTGGLSPHSDSDKHAIGYRNFLKKLYEFGGAQAADAIGIHPYPGVGPTKDYIGDVRVYLGKVQRVLRDNHDSDTPLWATEFGVSTTGPHAFDAGHQARALIELYDLLRHIHKVDLALVHRLVEDPSLAGREAGFGVLSQNLVPKPAFCEISGVRGMSPDPC